MTARVFVPSDSAALSLGAEQVAKALAELDLELDIVRNGSRGLYWLEPLIEIETEAGRLGFGPIHPAGVPLLFADGLPDSGHELCIGLVDELPQLVAQDRVTTQRCGIIEPLSLDDYVREGGFSGLNKARNLEPQSIVDAIKTAGLRGRGGAAFPTGIKWQTVLDTPAQIKYVVCNADEGDSGTFVDRMVMESDPYVLIEGIAIAALAVGASRGYIYCRSEYPRAIDTLNDAIDLAAGAGYLDGISIEVREGAGAYICGEETALLESLEGKRGMVRFRPPLPAIEGLFGKPTVINNVISLASVPAILAAGPESYAEKGVDRSRGTLTIQLAGNVRRGGLFEVPFGTSLKTVLLELGGGTATGKPIKAVQMGGPLGAYIPPEHFDTPLDYEAFKDIGAMIGHGGIVVHDETSDLGKMARFAMKFCADESCGKCTPCRVGAVRGTEVIDRIHKGENIDDNRILLKDLCQTMIDGSLCAMGGMTPFPVLSIMKHFPEEL